MKQSMPWVFFLLFIMSALTYLNFNSVFTSSNSSNTKVSARYLEEKQIKSIKLVSQGKTQLLQENEKDQMLDFLASSLRLKSDNLPEQNQDSFPFDKLIVEKNDSTHITLKPKFVMDNNIVFSLVGDQDYDFVIERSKGKLNSLINSLVM